MPVRRFQLKLIIGFFAALALAAGGLDQIQELLNLPVALVQEASAEQGDEDDLEWVATSRTASSYAVQSRLTSSFSGGHLPAPQPSAQRSLCAEIPDVNGGLATRPPPLCHA